MTIKGQLKWYTIMTRIDTIEQPRHSHPLWPELKVTSTEKVSLLLLGMLRSLKNKNKMSMLNHQEQSEDKSECRSGFLIPKELWKLY
jgi:hypothetical protein